MSLKQNATIVENTGGQLKFLKNRVFTVYDRGLNEDFTDTENYIFEDNRKKCSHIEIFNKGSATCLMAFDTTFGSIDPGNWRTYVPIYPGKPYNYLSLDGEASSISFKTLSGTSTIIEIIVW